MVDFVRLAATAERLINANGRTISVIKLEKTAADPAKPWRGPADSRDPAQTTVTGRGSFVPIASAASLGIDVAQVDNLKEEAQVCLFPANSDGGNSLERFDEILDRGARWQIVLTSVLQPADTRLMYFFVVQQQ